MADITKRLEQHLWNEQLDVSVTPPAVVVGIKGKNPSAGYTAVAVDASGNILLGANTAAIGTVDTELPAAAALADGASVTPTTPTVGAAMLGIRSTDGTATNLDRAILSKMFDLDTGANVENNVGVSLRKSASGGSTEYGTLTSPLQVLDQPITGTALVTYSLHSTTNATTTPTSSTAYISSIAISTVTIGTTSTVTIKDKSGTPLTLVPGVVTTATGVVIYNFQSPVKMTSGIDIVTAGAVAATVDIFISYFQ